MNLPVEGKRAGRVGSDVSRHLGGRGLLDGTSSSWSAKLSTIGLLLNIKWMNANNKQTGGVDERVDGW